MEQNSEKTEKTAGETKEDSEPRTEAVEEEKEATGDDNQSVNSIMGPFDEVLGNHFERLLGTKYGPDNLLLNLFTVSSLVMLATLETEIENFPYHPPKRLTYDKLLEEMAEINIEPSADTESEIDAMIEKGYIEVNDGRFFARKPAINVAQLIDKIFPKMPGLNLVAYLGQMMDEVVTGRKEIDTATNQFNQILEIQGVSINKKETRQTQSKTRLYPHLRVSDTPSKTKYKKNRAAFAKPANIYSQLKTKTYASPAFEAKTSSVSTEEKEQEIIDHVAGPVLSDGQQADPRTETLDETLDQNKGISIENEDRESDQEPKAPISDDEIEAARDPYYDKSVEKMYIPSSMEEPPLVQAEIDLEKEVERASAITDDEDIAKKIAAFEEQLGMTCPICGTAGIKANETARGKIYYHCVNSECNFISWGKPFYISCPQCSNPFLVEALNSAGKPILKCPRATCHHWENFPWDKPVEKGEGSPESLESPVTRQKPRRVVKRRRRVVRRKR